MEGPLQKKAVKVDAIKLGLHFTEDVHAPAQFDPEAYQKRLKGIMERDRSIIKDALTIKKRLL